MSPHTSIVILAAGLGTRMKSKRAKVLHRAGGLCLLEHVVRTALTVTAAENIVAIVGHQAAEVRAQVERHGIRFQLQTEQKGTGHAVLQAMGMPGLDHGRIVVLYGDCPLVSTRTLERLLAAHQSGATLLTMYLENPTGYGRIIQDAGGHVAAIVEEKAVTPEQRAIKEVNPGFYCFDAPLLWPCLAALRPNPASGEIYFTDVLEALRRDGHPAARCPVDDPTELLGINTRAELAAADQVLRERKVRELQAAGVTIEKPETVTIDADATAGPDTIIESFAQLLGRTTVGEDCHIGACSILRDTRVADGVTVHAFCHIDRAEIAAKAIVGPYARFRPGARLLEEAHVGNFVEVKNATLGARAKANHLAYIGDTEVGPASNIGAGTITCNYDGWKKHRTVIGARAFVGSNATLVAPLEIGDGAYIAAGSVITENVPADALGLGRSRQTNKPEWARKLREHRQKTSKG